MGNGNHKEIMNKLNAKIKSIDEKYKRFEEEKKLKNFYNQSKHIQPATVENHTLNGVRF